jgi:hypothetical protein
LTPRLELPPPPSPGALLPSAAPDAPPGAGAEEVLAARRRHYGPNAALNYERPLHMVRGEGCYLWDDQGRRYLDCANNVAHLGHCHPAVRALGGAAGRCPLAGCWLRRISQRPLGSRPGRPPPRLRPC